MEKSPVNQRNDTVVVYFGLHQPKNKPQLAGKKEGTGMGDYHGFYNGGGIGNGHDDSFGVGFGLYTGSGYGGKVAELGLVEALA